MGAGVVSLSHVRVPKAGVAPSNETLYVGTYSQKVEEGILRLTLDVGRGVLSAPQPASGNVNPAGLVLHPTGRFLFATCLVLDADGEPTGGVAAFAIDRRTGDLRELDRRPSGGTGPCHLSVDSEGRCLLVANCGKPSVACLAIEPEGGFGELSTIIPHQGVSRNSEQKPQAHSINVFPGNRFAVAADLGLDRLFVYRLDSATARLTPHDPPFVRLEDGAGPRHFAFHPGGSFAYSINELSNTVTALTLDREGGELKIIQTVSTLPTDFQGKSYAADVQVHPNGKFLYGSNRMHDSIAVFGIASDTGRLQPLGHTPSGGRFPRSIALDPSENFLIVANQKSNNLVVFRVDSGTGHLEAIGQPVSAPRPVCVRFRPGGEKSDL